MRQKDTKRVKEEAKRDRKKRPLSLWEAADAGVWGASTGMLTPPV